MESEIREGGEKPGSLPLIRLLERIDIRLRRKLQNAEDAYIRAKTQKKTCNCFHAGKEIKDRIRICKIQAVGAYEGEASICYDEKARNCEEFSLFSDVEKLRDEFRSLSETDVRLRWPSLGELYWLRKELKRYIDENL